MDTAVAMEYATNGWTVLRAFASREEVQRLVEEVERELRARQVAKERVRPPAFRALSDAAAFADLRESAGSVRAFGAPGSVETVGHGFHVVSGAESELARIALSERVRRACVGLDGSMATPVVAQTKFILKQAHVGARVPVHTDAQYIYTDPGSGLALWVALDEADESNGCIEVVSGSHAPGEFAAGSRFACGGPNGAARWLSSSSPSPFSKGGGGEKPFPFGKAAQDALVWTPVPAKPGDCVVMHRDLLHRSAPNTSSLPRRAAAIHVVDGACSFPDDNWIPRECLRAVPVLSASPSSP